MTLPFLEDFENIMDTTFYENGRICNSSERWNIETLNGGVSFTSNTPINNGGTGALLLANNSFLDANDVILTMDLSNYIGSNTIFLDFDYFVIGNYYGINDSIWIRGNNAADWVNIHSRPNQNEYDWVSVIGLDVDSTLVDAGQDFSNSFQIKFANKTFGPYPFGGWLLDNISLSNCSKPTAQTVSNIGPTSAVLAWTEIGGATSWNVEWGIKGFSLGAGNLEQNISSTSYGLSNLVNDTSYDFYVQSVCEESTSNWIGPYSFKTLCATTSTVTLPFLEDFENIVDSVFSENKQICNVNGNWTYETTGGRAYFGTTSYRNNGGTGALLMDSYNYSNIASINAAILTLDMSNYLGANNIFLTFDFYDSSDALSPNDSIWVRGSSADEWIGLYDWQNQDEYVWHTTPELDIDAALTNSGQDFSNNFQIRFGQEGHNSYSSDGLIIDNIKIGNCSKPKDINAVNITANSAEVIWTELGASSEWDIEWGPKDFLRGNGIQVTATSTSYALSNLFPAFSYDFYIRSNCGDTASDWVGPFTVATNCSTPNPITLPYKEDFENVPAITFNDKGNLCSTAGNWDIEITEYGQASFGTNASRNNGGLGALYLRKGYEENSVILTKVKNAIYG